MLIEGKKNNGRCCTDEDSTILWQCLNTIFWDNKSSDEVIYLEKILQVITNLAVIKTVTVNLAVTHLYLVIYKLYFQEKITLGQVDCTADGIGTGRPGITVASLYFQCPHAFLISLAIGQVSRGKSIRLNIYVLYMLVIIFIYL